MQRSPCVFRVASSLCPMRVRSRSALKRFNPKQARETQAERNEARRILESGPVDLESLQLAYPPRTAPEFVLKNGWCPPPASKPDLPFQVARTGKGGFIPVYRDIKNGRTRTVTIVKKATGDMKAFTSDLSKVCQGNKVEARGGELRIEGDHATNVKRWLSGLGF
ncbi:unnamed protein product [Ectocarpus sp. 8 AP-2014]